MKKILLCLPLLLLCCACNRHSKEEVEPLTEEHAHDFTPKEGAKHEAESEKTRAPAPGH